jgi:hypothetical protein
MIPTMIRTTIAALSLALAGTIGTMAVQQHRLSAERANEEAFAYAAMNARAERDTTRALAGVLGDSLRLVQKQVVQVAQRRDSIDRALGSEHRAVYRMSAVVDSLRVRVAAAPAFASAAASSAGSAVPSDTSVRRAAFNVRHAPYTVAAQVDIPLAPDSAHLSLDIALDTLDVTVRLACGTGTNDGVPAASIAASTPVWAAVRFGKVEQSPEVCRSPAASRPARRHFAFAPAIGLGRAVLWGGGAGWALMLGGVVIWA